jgi:hypothetical protein
VCEGSPALEEGAEPVSSQVEKEFHGENDRKGKIQLGEKFVRERRIVVDFSL